MTWHVSLWGIDGKCTIATEHQTLSSAQMEVLVSATRMRRVDPRAAKIVFMTTHPPIKHVIIYDPGDNDSDVLEQIA